MKKLLLSILCMCFLAPIQAKASNFSGVYVAPKFAINFVSMQEIILNVETLGVVVPISSNSKLDDTLFSGSLAIGYDFNSKFNIPVRAELEYSLFSQFSSNVDFTFANILFTGINAEINMQTLLLNAYYDFHNSSKFTPYIGLGIGIAFVGADANDPMGTIGKNKQTNFAWNIGVGSSYAFTDKFSLDLAYRYAQFGKGETETLAIPATSTSPSGEIWGSTDTISAHQVMLGVRYTF